MQIQSDNADVAVAVVGDTVMVCKPGATGVGGRTAYYSLVKRADLRAAVDNYLVTKDVDAMLEALSELTRHALDSKVATALGVHKIDGAYAIHGRVFTTPELEMIDNMASESLRGRIRLCLRLRACVDASNPGMSEERVNALLRALAASETSVSDGGDLIMFKAVRCDGWSNRGNTEMRVICGKVNAYGQILNTPGTVIEVDESQVCNDPGVECGPGLHLALNNRQGGNTLLARLCPEDLVCFPYAEWQVRCKRYTVIGYQGAQS